MLEKLNNKLLFLSALFVSQVAMADPLDSLPNSSDPGATIPKIGERLETGIGWFYTIIKTFAVILGLWMVISSLLKLKAIANNESDGSMWGAWFGIVVGGMLSGVTTWLWAVGATAEDVAGVR